MKPRKKLAKKHAFICSECGGPGLSANPSAVTCKTECYKARRLRLQRENYTNSKGIVWEIDENGNEGITQKCNHCGDNFFRIRGTQWKSCPPPKDCTRLHWLEKMRTWKQRDPAEKPKRKQYNLPYHTPDKFEALNHASWRARYQRMRNFERPAYQRA